MYLTNFKRELYFTIRNCPSYFEMKNEWCDWCVAVYRDSSKMKNSRGIHGSNGSSNDIGVNGTMLLRTFLVFLALVTTMFCRVYLYQIHIVTVLAGASLYLYFMGPSLESLIGFDDVEYQRMYQEAIWKQQQKWATENANRKKKKKSS